MVGSSSPAQSATFSLEKAMASVRGVRAQFQEAAHLWPLRRGPGGDAMSFAATSGAKAWDELLIVKMSGTKLGLASEDLQEPDLEVRCGACASMAPAPVPISWPSPCTGSGGHTTRRLGGVNVAMGHLQTSRLVPITHPLATARPAWRYCPCSSVCTLPC